MKNIYKGLVLVSTMLAFCSMAAIAQESNDILLTEQDSSDYKVQLPFRTVQQEDLLGGVSVIDMNELNKKAYTTYSLDMLNNLVGGASNGIWGISDYLVIVDGMVRDANNVLPHEIAQITVLKGAAAVVLYGSRASKGVVQITTKRGEVGDLRIKVTANTGFYVPKSIPTYLGSAEYMSYYNQARINDGNEPSFSAETIYNYASGKNPYRYPNINMYDDEYLRKAYNRSEAIAEITAGNERVKFYSTVGYYRESSLLKIGNHKDDYISRFFVRGNIDMKLHDLITARTDANVTYYDSYTAKGDWWSNAATLRPNRVAPLIPLSYIEDTDPNTLATVMNSNYIIGGQYFFGATQEHQTNPIADAYAAGDSKFVSRQFQFNTHFDVNLRPILDGLFFRAQYGIDYASTYNQGYNNNYATFAPVWNNYSGKDLITSVTQYGKDQKSGNEDISNSAYRYTYNMSFQFDYQKTFAQKHNVFGMIVANAWQTQQNGVYHHKTNVNLGAQLSYNLDHKYYIDFSAAVPYSAKLPEGNRAGFSPTVTLGWRPTKEAFWSDNSIFDDLMLTASAGIIMQDIDITDGSGNDYYLYKMILQSGDWYSWGDLGGLAATEFQRGDNMDMTFVKRKEFTVGLRGSMLNRGLSFDFNFFANKMDGMLTRASSLYPIYFTQTGYPTSSIIPFINYNIDKRIGFDFALTGRKKIGQVEAQLGVTGMYFNATAVQRDENYAYDYQTRMGRPLNAIWGLKSNGLFQSQEEIDNAPNQTFATVKPGDIRYLDQNGDNAIDANDEVYLGRGDDAFTMGINLTLKWKDFTLFAMGNGSFGGLGLKSNSYYWVRGEDKYSDIVREAWTPDNPNATYPRLTATNGDNNFRNSDYWIYKRDRFELRQVQLTYAVPQPVLKGSFIKGLDIFASGYNLLTISKERKVLEMNVGSAPQTRFFNIGFKGTF